MGAKDILVEKKDGLATITINRPDRLNALGNTTTVELGAACEEAIRDPKVRVLMITGAGEAFCAGGDYKDTFERGFEMSASQWRSRIRNGPNRFATLLSESEKPVIACVNGVAVGGGTTIALACDMRIASDRARFCVPFSRIGATPEFGCTYLLPRVVGLAKALELLFTSRMIGAEEAERIGLVNRVVPHEELKTETMKLVGELMDKPPMALGMMKSMVYRSLSMDFPAVLELEALALSHAFKTSEHQEVVQAFLSRKSSK